MHVRQQIRDALHTNLLTVPGVTTVTKKRDASYSVAQLPAINIITDEDVVDTGQEWNKCTEHTILQTVRIEVYVAQCEGVEDKLDDLIVDVQRNVYTDLQLGTIATGIRYISSTKIENRGQSELHHIVRELEFEVKYISDLLNPDVSTSH